MKITLTFEGIAGTQRAILSGSRVSRAYANGVAGEADGVRYDIVCYGNGFEKVSVKVPGSTTPPISQEELDARNACGDFVFCTFDGFSGKVYENYSDKSVRVSASAKKINILPSANVK